MNREDIVDLWSKANGWSVKEFNVTVTELEHFATLVAAAEREAIIKMAADLYFWDDSERLIKAIRARGQQ